MALEDACEKVETPLQRFEHTLLPWVRLIIMPLFALANAGVALGSGTAASTSPISLGIVLGLVVGKPIGIFCASWLAVRVGLASLPAQVGWRQILGVGALGGIGFTMSIFIAGLAFAEQPLLEVAKLGIFAASLVAGAQDSFCSSIWAGFFFWAPNGAFHANGIQSSFTLASRKVLDPTQEASCEGCGSAPRFSRRQTWERSTRQAWEKRGPCRGARARL